MRKALIVGIDYYDNVTPLHGCVNDAHSVNAILSRHSNGTPNFGTRLYTATGKSTSISRKELKNITEELFKEDSDIALFYYSGHGYVEGNEGYIITSECEHGDDGFRMGELIDIANNSKAKNKIIILDCCHAGIAGNVDVIKPEASILCEGLTILAASSKDQYAIEENGTGVFTNLFVDALNGSAANLVGSITPGSVYAHIDQSLGPWQQRPIFKTNVKRFITLREVQPSIQLDEIRKITELFKNKGDEFKLDPSFEPTEACHIEDNGEQFKLLQKYNHVNLVIPIGEEHMYYAAVNSKSCKLTVLGVHYWNLVKKGRI